MYKVFVYGTLKRGFGNNRLLRDSRYISDLVTAPMFEMFAVGVGGGFPIILHGQRAVLGELWEVDDKTLRSLDGLEGVPHMYERRSFNVPEIGDVFYYHWNRHPTQYKTGVHDGPEFTRWIG